ncbi:type VI secretion system baseplate subunit TssK [Massilia endophytica]|uniref:type VI secretion system baseplate subunit TssK n=1 Tax=Massilia endophytica TaxID=2899220 RepID=UPI001E394D2E|nr:type VI secretion system baseplate subunit TssK [Massilia endophytica]UGQ44833.1 type VI secretion system baseplate subunit TssK [Massilia endophytica]
MATPSKVLWSEGLFLRPQHFQQQDYYHETRLQRIAHALHAYPWGVLEAEWDAAALRNNTLRVTRLNAVFRDGEIVDAPSADALPPPIDLGVLPQEVQEMVFYAGLPSLNRDGVNLPADPGEVNCRYARKEADTPDMFTGALPAELSYLRKTPRMLSALEPRGSFDCLPLLKLRRSVAGGFEADAAFVAPCLTIGSSPWLLDRLEQLLEALQAKAGALQGHMREPSRNVVEFRSGDVSAFWLLHTVSAAAATLLHHLRNPALHPERLFEAMLTLAGSLMTYSRSYQLGSLPIYAHADPGPAFAQLDAIIRDLLDTVISARYFSIALTEEKPSYHLGKLDSGKIDGSTTLYLAIGAAMPLLELVEAVPLRVKAGAPDDVEQCVLSAMPGVRLVHAPQVPSAIPVRPDTCYFVLEPRGVLYEQMLKAQSISVYVPAGIRDLRLELLAVAA